MRLKFLILFLMLCSQMVVSAQASIPLVIVIDGQLYRWSPGEPEPTFTGCDLQGKRLGVRFPSLTVSSTGEWAAFMAMGDDELHTGPDSTGNLWVCNVAAGEAYPLSHRDNTYQVSQGAFSPDGTRIAWTETDNGGQETTPATLFVHDFATKATTILNDSLALTEYCGIGTGAPRIIWGKFGIAAGYFKYDPNNPCNGNEEIGFAHYSEDGTLLNAFPVPDANFDGFEWLAGDEPRLAFFGHDRDTDTRPLYSVDMTTGEVRRQDAALEAFIPPGLASTPGTYIVARPDLTDVPPYINLPASDENLEAYADVALSPDGTEMAMLIGRTLYLAADGKLQPAAWNMDYFGYLVSEDTPMEPNFYDFGQLEIAWATPEYRLVPVPATTCPQAAPLPKEGILYLIPGLGRNNVRSAPGVDAAVIGKLDEGEAVMSIESVDYSSVLDEPADVCAVGVRWREVLFENRIGWTAESQANAYFLTDGQG